MELPVKMNFKKKIFRDRSYLDYIKSLPCCNCGREAEPHHTQVGGTGIKGSDYRTVPMCRTCHMILHQNGKETFQKKFNVNFNERIIEYLEEYLGKG